MLQLTRLLQQRIRHAQNIPSLIQTTLGELLPCNTLDQQFLANRAVMRLLAKSKKHEKERVDRESRILVDIKSNSFTSTAALIEFHDSLQKLMTLHHPSYSQDPPSTTHGKPQGATSRLRRLLWLLIGEEHFPEWLRSDAMQVIGNDLLTGTNPWILMGWVCEWSRKMFNALVQEETAVQLARHQEEMNRLHKGMDRALASRSFTRSDEVQILTLSNKESVYGLIIDEMHSYYKSMGQYLQLDMGFPKSMRKLNSKGNEFEREENLTKAAEILAESKNKPIKELMERYEQQWKEYAEGKGIKMEQARNNSRRFSLISMLRKKPLHSKAGHSEPVSVQLETEKTEPKLSKQSSFLLGGFQKMKDPNADKRQLQLPQIVPHANFAKAQSVNKPIYKHQPRQIAPRPRFQGFNNASFLGNLSSQESGLLLEEASTKCVTPKSFKMRDFHSLKELPSVRLSPKKKKHLKIIPHSNPEVKPYLVCSTEIPKSIDEANRKLMLQLLREKNKRMLVQ